MPDGRLIFPKRGGPPRVPDGYDVDPQDPYVMIPQYEECTKRTTIPTEMPCGKIHNRPWCKLHNCEATPMTCLDCPDVDFGLVAPPIIEQPPTGVTHEVGVTQDLPLV